MSRKRSQSDDGPYPKKSKKMSVVISELMDSVWLPYDLAKMVVEEYANYWRPLTDDFLETLTREYFSELEATCDHLEVFDLPTLAESAKSNMEEWLENELQEPSDVEKFRKLYAENHSDPDNFFETTSDFQWKMFWTFYPVFNNVDRMFDKYAKDHLNGDCVDSDEYLRNQKYSWDLITFALSLDHP